jgi:hypothetical protein
MNLATPRALLFVPGLALGLAGCDPEPTELVEVTSFEHGIGKDTEGGAFRVVLYSREGLEVGSNELVARVGFHDPSDPLAPGYGIPGARVRVDVFPVSGEGEPLELEAIYAEDGCYLFEDLELSAPGAWQFEFEIEVGETLDESVAFAFEIDG